MIEIKQANGKNFSGTSLFIKFNYDLAILQMVKSLSKRWYHAETRTWETPVENLKEVLHVFRNCDVVYDLPISTAEAMAKEEKAKPQKLVEMPKFEFKTKPFNHQIEAFNYAQRNAKFLLGDEQGLGKTKQGIDIAVSRKPQMKHCLIIVGVNSLRWNWFKEVSIHSNESARILGMREKNGKFKDGTLKDRLQDLQSDLAEFFLITNIETLRNKEILSKLEQMTKSGQIGMIILDEAHKCKNPNSTQGKAIHALKSKFKIAATGTPLMNSPLDCFNVLKWLEAEKGNFYSFRSRYAVMGGFGGYQVVAYKNLQELNNRMQQVMLRRKKSEALDLPAKTRTVEFVDLEGKQLQLYREILLNLRANISELEKSPNPLSQLIRLRQATSNPRLLTEQDVPNAKIERLVELVEEVAENGKKAIVFSNWESVTAEAKKALAAFNPAYITGSVEDRQAEVEKFQNQKNCSVIIGTIGAMGTGLTLTAGTTVVFIDKPWNMANVEQAEDRAHRIGTTENVSIITLAAKNTIDEKIEAIIEGKAGMSDAIVDGNFDRIDKRQLLEFLISE